VAFTKDGGRLVARLQAPIGDQSGEYHLFSKRFIGRKYSEVDAESKIALTKLLKEKTEWLDSIFRESFMLPRNLFPGAPKTCQ